MATSGISLANLSITQSDREKLVGSRRRASSWLGRSDWKLFNNMDDLAGCQYHTIPFFIKPLYHDSVIFGKCETHIVR